MRVPTGVPRIPTGFSWTTPGRGACAPLSVCLAEPPEPYCTAIDTKWVVDPADPLCVVQCLVRRCLSDGTETITLNGTEITEAMAMTLIPPGTPVPTCERVDVLPLNLEGAAGPFTYAELLTQALAAAAVDYPTFGAAADTDEILAVNISVGESGQSFLLNGEVSGGLNDPDGVNAANSVEVPDGCEINVAFCLQRCLTKAEIAAL